MDHIIPLQGVEVSGLDIPDNLQVITETENLTKSKCNPLYDQILNKNKKCLFIGIDGLRPDCLLFANTPNIDRIIKGGTINFETETITETYSGPSWCSILSGKDQNETEIFSNDIVEDENYKWKTNNIFKDLNDLQINTYAFTNTWIGIKNIVKDAKYKDYIETDDIYMNDIYIINKTIERISKNEMNIDISKYPSGIYHVYFRSEEHCSSAEQQISRKIILNK